ncbi:hypothetical protein STA3757_49740 (plasmid) [Stanieria sp. NIES-3757]|nr:hypothetical protein STA3757_49740 [Stanieria sp. NIES-3757]
MKTKRQEEFGQEFQDSKKLLRNQELAEKKIWLSGILGSIFGGFGAYVYCERYRNIIPGLLLSVVVGCVAAPSLAEETCENTGYGTECSHVVDFAPIFLLVAIIDNANAITNARKKLKKFEEAGF